MLCSGCVSHTALKYMSSVKGGVQVTIIFMADISTAFDKDWSTAWEAQQSWLKQKEEHDAAEAKKAKEVCLCTSPPVTRKQHALSLATCWTLSPIDLGLPFLLQAEEKKDEELKAAEAAKAAQAETAKAKPASAAAEKQDSKAGEAPGPLSDAPAAVAEPVSQIGLHSSVASGLHPARLDVFDMHVALDLNHCKFSEA